MPNPFGGGGAKERTNSLKSSLVDLGYMLGIVSPFLVPTVKLTCAAKKLARQAAALLGVK